MTFICEKCGCIDNSACGGNYWSVATKQNAYKDKYANEQLLCVECTPTEFVDGTKNNQAGKWHNKFPKLHWSRVNTKEDILYFCGKNTGSFVNAVEYFKEN